MIGLRGIDADTIAMATHLGVALTAGGAIGFERSYHGRPAGFRTHVLVCISSALLMMVTMYQSRWFPENALGKVTTDPTRMTQGIMTGIGFLGAGVIMKEGLSVRGLTTAASIWITAAIGVLAGIGFYGPVLMGTVLTLLALAVFRWLERALPGCSFAHVQLSFPSERAPPEDELRRTLNAHGFTVSNLSYRLDNASGVVEYGMMVRARRRGQAQRLVQTWNCHGDVLEFRITPT
jgi:putative Mg2+ transporter-C (MgtC) family protein